VDVDLVASELDFQTLQEHITGVTFCNVEGERCVRCQSPVDPALLKLFRLAQLTVEYLLHSQEYLTLSLGAAEERLQTQAREHQQLLAQQQKQADQAKVLKTELKQRKKIIALNQQAMINMTNCHKVLNTSSRCHFFSVSVSMCIVQQLVPPSSWVPLLAIVPQVIFRAALALFNSIIVRGVRMLTGGSSSYISTTVTSYPCTLSQYWYPVYIAKLLLLNVN
jgi:hypothetical protein